MLSNKFISLVEDHADHIIENWLKEVKSNPSTRGYKKLSDEVLKARVDDVVRRLGDWLPQDEDVLRKTAEHFINLGRERHREGLKASEVVYALMLTRVAVWKYVVNHALFEHSLDLHQALDFYHAVTTFFDKAEYFVAVGFESMTNREGHIHEEEDFVEKVVKSVTNWLIKT